MKHSLQACGREGKGNGVSSGQRLGSSVAEGGAATGGTEVFTRNRC